MSDKPIIIITAGDDFAFSIINEIANNFAKVSVLIENSESKLTFLKRRVKKLGLIQTMGQFGTMVVSKLGKKLSKTRTEEIKQAHHLNCSKTGNFEAHSIPSANSIECLEHINKIDPAVIMLISCRLLTAKTLSKIPCKVLNYHSGVCPSYRGMQGGYWALATNDSANFGTTVHIVDAGVDTGDIIDITYITPTKADSILTYSLLMAAHSRKMCVKAVDDSLNNTLKTQKATGHSKQWYHPPLWSYLKTGFCRSIW